MLTARIALLFAFAQANEDVAGEEVFGIFYWLAGFPAFSLWTRSGKSIWPKVIYVVIWPLHAIFFLWVKLTFTAFSPVFSGLKKTIEWLLEKKQ